MELKRIAYVEDDPDIREVAHIALRMVGGYELTTFISGQQALEHIPALQPQLILLDVMMPGLDGPTTLNHLREIPEARGIPVIFMTAKIQTQEVDYYKALGALGVIGKPFDPMTLSENVQRMWLEHEQGGR